MILGSDSPHPLRRLWLHGYCGEEVLNLPGSFWARPYDIPYPRVAAIYLTGAPAPGVGPHDVALALVEATFKEGIVKMPLWSSLDLEWPIYPWTTGWVLT